MSTRWVSLTQLADEVGMVVRSLQYIRTQEPGVLVSRQRGKVTEYEQPTCAINLRNREVAKHKADAGPADYDVARARREQANAEIAEMNAAKLRGDMAPVSDMVKQIDRMAAAVRSEVLGLRSRFVGRIVGLTTEIEAATVMDAMSAQILAALVDRVEVEDDEHDDAGEDDE
jgi:hypothetical protein